MAKTINQSALDELMETLSTPTPANEQSGSIPENEESFPSKDGNIKRTRRPKTKETFCATVTPELIGKVRAIASREHVSITELIDTALSMLIRQYESKHGPVKVKAAKKGNITDIFDL